MANLLGYGGGPSTIPLIQDQVVTHYHWLTNPQFANILAVGNTLPGPIATKTAGIIGYSVDGWIGALLALAATILPSAVGIILLLQVVARFRNSRIVKGMTLLIQPVIAVMLAILALELLHSSVARLGWFQALIIVVLSVWLLKFRKVHPVFVILAAFVYGGLILPLFSVI